MDEAQAAAVAAELLRSVDALADRLSGPGPRYRKVMMAAMELLGPHTGYDVEWRVERAGNDARVRIVRLAPRRAAQ